MTATPDELKALTRELTAVGHKTPGDRKEWIETVLGRPFSKAVDLTSDDIARCLKQIDTDRKALGRVVEIAKRVFRIS